MSQPLERLLLGRTLAERYLLEEVQGRGGMSLVFRATDLRLGRELAVKVVMQPAGTETDPARLRERFRREAAAAAAIPPHPNVVQVYDYGTDPELDLDFIAMELLRGRDLRQRLAESGPPARPEALRIVLDAARGVAAGHRAGILHRDVKPGNVFLVGEREVEAVRVLDFGIAKALEPAPEDETLTVAGQLPHSPAYASPEQMDADATLTPASDVYQLGLVAYETLTGERPYTAEERERVRSGEELPARRPDSWQSIPAAIRAVVERALSREPDRRYPDAAAFASALAEADAGTETTLLAPATAPESAAAPPALSRRLPIPRPAAAAAVLAAILALALCFRGSGDTGPGDGPVASAQDELDATFLALQGAVAGAGGAETGPRTVTASSGNDDIIRAAVHDLNRAWVDGDLSRHVAHYASRVDYYNSRRLPRSGVRRDRLRDLRRYAAMRAVEVDEIQVESLDEETRRAVARKSWDLRGEGQTRIGRGVVEYVFRRDEDGRWYVVSEQLLSQSEIRTPAAGSP